MDRSFVCDMLTDRAHRAIVHGVITIASSFGCKVIAEGVESHEQCACLSDMGCHWAQGFYFARPMAVEDFYRWLQTREQTSQPQLAS
ncbi:EAL domain-containing protein [Comamonas kerstersii]|uniref:EAL domain-containing protein n=1 Tax=Comamonas kerstersii TaxID=225992 RepID=UPI0020C3063A|nr:EAL domain-containing protein [Comamonas kerstersii]